MFHQKRSDVTRNRICAFFLIVHGCFVELIVSQREKLYSCYHRLDVLLFGYVRYGFVGNLLDSVTLVALLMKNTVQFHTDFDEIIHDLVGDVSFRLGRWTFWQHLWDAVLVDDRGVFYKILHYVKDCRHAFVRYLYGQLFLRSWTLCPPVVFLIFTSLMVITSRVLTVTAAS